MHVSSVFRPDTKTVHQTISYCQQPFKVLFTILFFLNWKMCLISWIKILLPKWFSIWMVCLKLPKHTRFAEWYKAVQNCSIAIYFILETKLKVKAYQPYQILSLCEFSLLLSFLCIKLWKGVEEGCVIIKLFVACFCTCNNNGNKIMSTAYEQSMGTRLESSFYCYWALVFLVSYFLSALIRSI